MPFNIDPVYVIYLFVALAAGLLVEGVYLLFFNTRSYRKNVNRRLKLLDKQVDGLIVAPCDTERSDHLKRALKEGCPIVQFDRMVKGLGADAVTVDNRKASREAIGSLIEAGHRRIAILWSMRTSRAPRCDGVAARTDATEGTPSAAISAQSVTKRTTRLGPGPPTGP